MLEITSSACACVSSRYNEPWQVRAKVKPLTNYAGGVYRLETNDQLYEGVRFVWLIVDPGTESFHITGLRLQAMVKPVNYTGSFHSTDTELSGCWYSGAYGSRLNMMPCTWGVVLAVVLAGCLARAECRDAACRRRFQLYSD